jgi:hypothetical protein
MEKMTIVIKRLRKTLFLIVAGGARFLSYISKSRLEFVAHSVDGDQGVGTFF